VRKCDFTPAQVYGAKEVIVTGTLGVVTPVSIGRAGFGPLVELMPENTTLFNWQGAA